MYMLLFLCILVYDVVVVVVVHLSFLFSVRAYVCPTDNDLAIEIQKAAKDYPAGLHSLFSRNKMFRRKLKRKKEQH